jgi:hypothetical protein
MTASNSNDNDRRRLWMRIGEDFRQACLLRREGKTVEAAEILEKKLPAAIANWARISGFNEADRKERLNDLFEMEQRRVDDIWLSHQIVMRQMRDILIPSLCLQVAEEVREVMELQIEHLTESLTRISTPAVPAQPRQEPVAANLIKLPTVMPSERRNTPNFDDLPVIIDELIADSLAQQPSLSRLAALV